VLSDITGVSVLTDRIMTAVNARKSLIIQGPNGVGKTSAVHQVARKLSRHVEVFLGPSIHPETFGMNVPNRDFDSFRYVWSERFVSVPENTIFLIDEFSFMPPTVQALLGEAVLSHSIQGRPLPHGTVFILTANRLGDTAGVNAISRLINTRCPTVTYYGPTDEEFVGSDKMPGYLATHGHPAINTALQYNPGLIHFLKGEYPKQEQTADKLPTHRGWVECSAELRAAEELYNDGAISSINRLAILASHVGDKAAAKCEVIVRLWQDLPDFNKMTSQKLGTMEVPKNPVVRSLIISQVADVAKEGLIAHLDPLISRFPAEEQKVMWVRLLEKSSHFASTSAYQKFSSGTGKFLNS
jgi:DNA polymerase III delta prime subunit